MRESLNASERENNNVFGTKVQGNPIVLSFVIIWLQPCKSLRVCESSRSDSHHENICIISLTADIR